MHRYPGHRHAIPVKENPIKFKWSTNLDQMSKLLGFPSKEAPKLGTVLATAAVALVQLLLALLQAPVLLHPVALLPATAVAVPALVPASGRVVVLLEAGSVVEESASGTIDGSWRGTSGGVRPELQKLAGKRRSATAPRCGGSTEPPPPPPKRGCSAMGRWLPMAPNGMLLSNAPFIRHRDRVSSQIIVRPPHSQRICWNMEQGGGGVASLLPPL